MAWNVSINRKFPAQSLLRYQTDRLSYHYTWLWSFSCNVKNHQIGHRDGHRISFYARCLQVGVLVHSSQWTLVSQRAMNICYVTDIFCVLVRDVQFHAEACDWLLLTTDICCILGNYHSLTTCSSGCVHKLHITNTGVTHWELFSTFTRCCDYLWCDIFSHEGQSLTNTCVESWEYSQHWPDAKLLFLLLTIYSDTEWATWEKFLFSLQCFWLCLLQLTSSNRMMWPFRAFGKQFKLLRCSFLVHWKKNCYMLLEGFLIFFTSSLFVSTEHDQWQRWDNSVETSAATVGKQTPSRNCWTAAGNNWATA